jgi:hypothetical protein
VRIAPALRFMAERASFAVQEMPELSPDAKLVLARRAVREGLLTVSPSPAARGPTGAAGAG